ncbi:MAG TPA: hypothetical protein VEV15_04795 [Flavisolibacter sp.]|nr:hypothetical protein [Flavisolibacter sp.]
MKKVLVLCLAALLAGCTKEQIARNAVITAMTTGYWKVASFKNGSTDLTTDFAPYKFQFKENLTVDAINNTTIERTGTWTADANAKTITSFFSNAGHPLILLNGTWQITRSDWTFVEASQTANNELRTLRLEKN